jgi:hypothetical protein
LTNASELDMISASTNLPEFGVQFVSKKGPVGIGSTGSFVYAIAMEFRLSA